MKKFWATFGLLMGHFWATVSLSANNLETTSTSDINATGEVSSNIETIYFAGGCFWGIEYHFEKLKGVKSVESGYMGGTVKNPTYRDVSRGNSGYLELVEVIYDSSLVSYESLAKLFFEIHDSTQKDGQGPDIGQQYLSVVFTSDSKEKKTIKKLLKILKSKGIESATKIVNKTKFYQAEDYHQDYYEKHNKQPYCHAYKKIF